MQNQNRSPAFTETSKTKKLNIPQVRYHPSIQPPPGVARTPPNNRTRTSQNQKTRPLTGTKTAHQNQEVNATDPESRSGREGGRRQNLKPEPAQSKDPEPVQRSELKPFKKSEPFGLDIMTQNQNRSPTTTETSKTKRLNIPQVRYHPSIQPPPGVARTPPNIRTRTRTSQNQSTRPLTVTKAAQENQEVNTTNSELRLDCEEGRRQNLKPEPAQNKDPNPVQRSQPKPSKKSELVPKPKPVQKPGAAGDGSSGGTRPVPEEVPLGVGGHLDRCVVEQVEVLTRGQRTNPHWFSWRKNRITASVAHSIAHSRFANGRSQTPPTSYLSAITGEAKRVQTRAMSWGVQMEAEAVRRYQVLKTSMLGRRVSVRDCGLFVDACRPWLAGTPDGIVTDDSSGEWLLCLEVKCPYKHRERRVEDACRDDPRFCLQIENEDALQPAQPPVYRLKTSHSYYTQIQVQLAVTGLQRAELVVFTLKETAVVPVTFDPELWEETVSKLERFYRDAVLPRIREKKQENAVWTPEL